MSKVYLCGPINGLTYEEARFGWRKDLRHLVDDRIELLSPMRQEGYLQELTKGQAITGKADHSHHFMGKARAIFAKDKLDVQAADIVLCNLLPSTKTGIISIGSLVELGWANALGKTVIVMMDEKNPHQHLFVNEVADFKVETLDEAAHILNALLISGI